MAAGAMQFVYSLPDEEDHGTGGGGGGAEEDHGAGAGGGGAPPPDRRACAVGAMFKVPHEVYLLPARHQGGYVAGKQNSKKRLVGAIPHPCAGGLGKTRRWATAARKV